MRPFNELDEGKIYFISWLRDRGFEDIIDTDTLSQFTHWDIEGTYKGERYIFELKNRTHPSSKYGDTAINKDKYEYLIHSPYKAILITFFTDCWCMIDVKSKKPDSFFHKMCPYQTRFQDHHLMKKEMVSWSIQNMKMLEYDQIRDCR